MSRPMRASYRVIQPCLPGPSSFSTLRFRAPTIQLEQRRTFLSFGLPSWLKRPTKKEDEENGETMTEESSTESQMERKTTGNLFDSLDLKEERNKQRKMVSEATYKTAQRKMSPRKLALLSRQVAGLPIDEAILQMDFSEKRASKWIRSMLAWSRDSAIEKGIRRSRMVVAQSWVSKGPKIRRIDIKGRARMGVKHHPTARLHILLNEGQTYDQVMARKWDKELNKVRSAGIVREDGKLRRKVISGWTW